MLEIIFDVVNVILIIALLFFHLEIIFIVR